MHSTKVITFTCHGTSWQLEVGASRCLRCLSEFSLTRTLIKKFSDRPVAPPPEPHGCPPAWPSRGATCGFSTKVNGNFAPSTSGTIDHVQIDAQEAMQRVRKERSGEGGGERGTKSTRWHVFRRLGSLLYNDNEHIHTRSSHTYEYVHGTNVGYIWLMVNWENFYLTHLNADSREGWGWGQILPILENA